MSEKTCMLCSHKVVCQYWRALSESVSRGHEAVRNKPTGSYESSKRCGEVLAPECRHYATEGPDHE